MSDSLQQQLNSAIPDSGERFIIFSIGFFLLAILGMLVYTKMKDADNKHQKSQQSLPS